jgi:hypothetical protein
MIRNIDYIKRQQLKWFGHVIRQIKLNIAQRVINKKKYENTRPKGRPRKQWISRILEALGNITAEKANRRAKDRNLSLLSTLRGNCEKEEEVKELREELKAIGTGERHVSPRQRQH